MRKSLPMCLIAVAGIAAGYLLNGNWVSAQQRPAEPRFAAVPSERGGQDFWGGFLPAVGWPKDLTTLPGHEGWTFGAGQSVFAENPNRVFVLQRGELPAIQRPRNQKIGPSVGFPIGRLPWRDATTASLPGNGGTGQIAEEGIQAWLKAGNVMGVDARWEHCILVYDAQRQPHRIVDAVGLDAPAAALRRHQPLRSAEARLDPRRPQARHLQDDE